MDFIVDPSLEQDLLADWGNTPPEPPSEPVNPQTPPPAEPSPASPKPPQEPVPPVPPTEPGPEPPAKPATEPTLIDKLLELKGFKDKKVYFLNDQGAYEETSFDELSEEDKLSILSQERGSNLTDDELNTVNLLRTKGINLQQLIQSNVDAAIEEYKRNNSAEYVSIKDMSDEELVLNDYKSRYKDALTDEQYQALVDKEKENEDLFKQKADALRKVMLEEESSYREMQTKANEEKMQAETKRYVEALNQAAGETTDIFGAVLTDEDRNDAMAYYLQTNDKGLSQFQEDMQDVKKQIKIAWLMTHGEEAMSDMVKYLMAEAKKQGQPKPSEKKPPVETPKSTPTTPPKTQAELSKLQQEAELRALGLIS